MEVGQEGNNQAQSSLTIPPPCSLPCTFSLSLFFSLSYSCFVSLVSLCPLSSLPGYTGPQGDLLLAEVPQQRTFSSPSLPTGPLPSPHSFSNTLPRGKTARPSSPELSISQGVYLQCDRPTHLEHIFTSVLSPSPSHSLLALYILLLPPDTFLPLSLCPC